MSKSIKFIYFDIGGVLLDWKEIFKELASEISRTPAEVESAYQKHELKALRGITSPREYWKQISRELKIPENSITDFRWYCISRFVPISQTHNFLRKIGKHYKIGLLTNINLGYYELCVKHGLVPDYDFTAVIKSCDIGLIKPEKAMFEHAREKAQVPHESILFIDDMKENIEGAKKIGWKAILFDTKHPEKSIKSIQALLSL